MATPNTFKVFWSNMGYYSQDEFSTLNAAVDYGKSKGFEFAVDSNGERLGAWSTFGGWTSFSGERI